MTSRTTRWRLRKQAGGLVVPEGSDSDNSADEAELAERRPVRLRLDHEPPQDGNMDVGRQVNGLFEPEPEVEAQDVNVNVPHGANVENPIDDILPYPNGIIDIFEQANKSLSEPEVEAQDMNVIVNGPDEPNDANLEHPIANGEDNVLSTDSEASSESEEGNFSTDGDNSDEEEPPPLNHLNDERLLYPGAQLTLYESIVAILTFALAHHLTGSSVADLLALIALHCPIRNTCVRSLYIFNKFFKNIGKEILVCHYYCSVRYKSLVNRSDACTQCNRVTKVSFFIEIPIIQQLQILFNRPGFYADLQFRFNRMKKSANNIEDIYDGRIYKEHVQRGFLSNPSNISFMWYTDGVSVFNFSNKFSIWPLYLVINELKYKQRVKKENIVLAGIWFGKRKPKANTFLEPFYTRLQDFYHNGHIFSRPNGPPVHVRGVMLCGTCDMPAKSTFLRIKQFNGNYGCPRCLQKGEQYEGSTVHVYRHSPNVPLRTNESLQLHGRAAVASGLPCFGVKGVSLLYRMVSDLIRSTGIDAMHGVFSGLGKALLELWFHSDHKESDFTLYHFVDSVNARLKEFKVPSFLNKFTQSVSDLTSWKSLDFKVWLFYYSIPVLSGLMSQVYLDHHMLLVSAVYILSQRSISCAEINQASLLLNKYVLEFETLYGLRFMGINVHQLTHLSQCVEDLGPLWVYSCYFMEDLNGQICKFIHGTSHVGIQIASATTKMQQLGSLISSLNPLSPAHSFCNKINKFGQTLKIAEVIGPGINVVGRITHLSVPPREILFQCLNIHGGHCQMFSRLWVKGVLFVAESYTRALKRNSSYVHFTINNVSTLGSIKYFIRWSDCHCATLCQCQPCLYLCFIQVYERIPWRAHVHWDNVAFSYLNCVRESANSVVVPVTSLRSLCFYLSVKDGAHTHQYIIERVNSLEAE
ncbi:hypothetical protein KUF71_025702 [Frankliniella fusca]|uniref:Transposase domain-containing protein n=1 Tax=Frankliniella fusca TaxID=407009 RepID=A0AAE1H869_9NEOP|nr:hypothetical protein KUF71_025702 [Frankliniella fusca]